MAFEDTLSLIFKIAADSKGAVADVQRFRQVVSSEIKAVESETAASTGAATSSVETFAGSFAAVTGAVTVAVGAIVGIGAVAAGVAGTIFALAKTSADFGDAIYQASLKTGLSVQALSALKLAAEENGKSLDDFSTGITRFEKLLGQAAEGSKAAAEKLTRLGLDPQKAFKDLDGSLQTVLKRIVSLPDPVSRANAAIDAFGKTGANLIPTIQSFHGNLDELEKKAESLGLTLSNKSAKDAHDFEVSLRDLEAQAKGVAVTFGRELLPDIVSTMRDISKVISDNRAVIKEWGDYTKNVLVGLKTIYLEVANYFKANPLVWKILYQTVGAVPNAIGNIVNGIASIGQETRNEQGGFAAGGASATPQTRNSLNPDASGDSDYLENNKEKAEAQKKLDEAIKNAREASLSELGTYQTRLKTVYDAGLEDLTNQLKTGKITDEAYKADALNREKLYTDLLIETLDRRQKAQLEAEKDPNKKNAIVAANQAELEKIGFESTKRRAEFEKTATEAAKKEITERTKDAKAEATQTLALRTAEAAQKVAIVEGEGLKESESIQKIANLERDLILEKRFLLEDELKSVRGNATEEKRIRAEIAVIDLQVDTQKIKTAQAVREARRQETEDSLADIERIKQAEDEDEAAAVDRIKRKYEYEQQERDKAFEEEQRHSKEETFGGSLAAGLSDLTPITNFGNALSQLGQIAGGVFSQIGQGVGQVVQSYVLLGNAGGQSLRKFTAEVLASVASQSAVLAVFELAKGFADLFFDPPSAAAHFTAAALFGSIAVVAAVAGRLTAGNAFQNQATGAASSSGNGSSSSSPTNDPRQIELTRQQAEQVLRLHIESNDSHIVNVVQNDVNNNGQLRQIIIKTADN